MSLTVHRNVKSSLSLLRSGSAKVKVFVPNTGLEMLPNEQDPVGDTLLWYSFKHTRNNV